MRVRHFNRLSDERLVIEFGMVARSLGETVVNWQSGVGLTKRLFAIRNVLRERGFASRIKLTALLEDENRFVRYYAALELITIFPQRSRSILEENAEAFDAIAGDARGIIRSIDNGEYQPI